jgi:hypothetical protein
MGMVVRVGSELEAFQAEVMAVKSSSGPQGRLLLVMMGMVPLVQRDQHLGFCAEAAKAKQFMSSR